MRSVNNCGFCNNYNKMTCKVLSFWDRLESKAGMIPVAKPVISEAFKDFSDDKVIKLATRVGKDTFHDIILFMRSKFPWLELWLTTLQIAEGLEIF